jgi:hypothetical protein
LLQVKGHDFLQRPALGVICLFPMTGLI